MITDSNAPAYNQELITRLTLLFTGNVFTHNITITKLAYAYYIENHETIFFLANNSCAIRYNSSGPESGYSNH